MLQALVACLHTLAILGVGGDGSRAHGRAVTAVLHHAVSVGGQADDDVVAVVGLDGVGDLILLQRVAGVLKLGNHSAGSENIAVGVVDLAGILAVLLLKLGKTGKQLLVILNALKLLRYLICLCLLLSGGGLVQRLAGAGVFGHKQDVVCGDIAVILKVFKRRRLVKQLAVLAVKLLIAALIKVVDAVYLVIQLAVEINAGEILVKVLLWQIACSVLVRTYWA